MDSLNKWFIDPLQNHFFDFDGRASVQQYWMFVLWYLIFAIILEVVGQDIVSSLYSLVLFIPSLAIATRRLHDIGKSGWWQLLWFIPIIGWIILLVFLVTKSDAGENAYGPNPKNTVSSIPVPVPPPVPTPAPTIPVAPSEPAVQADIKVDSEPK